MLKHLYRRAYNYSSWQIFLLCSSLLVISGCVSQQKTYVNPLENIGSSPSNSLFSNYDLGVVFSENSKNAMKTIQEHREKLQMFGAWAAGSGLEDMNANYLTSELDRVLNSQFKSVVRLENLKAAAGKSIDAVMILDIFIKIGAFSFDKSKVTVKGIFVDFKGKSLETIVGEGEGAVPWPATNVGFKPAVNMAVGSFNKNLGQASTLAQKLDNLSPSNMVIAASPNLELPRTSAVNFGNFYALVIGNNNYRNLPKLKTAIYDAEVVAEVLRNKYNFTVYKIVDGTRENIIKTFTKLRSQLTKNDNLLIYYAGHGWLDEEANRGYWLPVDAGKKDPTNWLSNATLTDFVRAMRARHVMIIADSCYSGTLLRGIRISAATPHDLSRLARKKARTVLTSGGLEPVADSGGGRHSVFAKALITVLENNQKILDGTSLFSKVRELVILNADQTPEYSNIHKAGHEGGDFIFRRVK
ncbi:MAG: caspase family protein [Nitrospinae bacterium]|nr:caspase family protein [Nitrospinota bacterium]